MAAFFYYLVSVYIEITENLGVTWKRINRFSFMAHFFRPGAKFNRQTNPYGTSTALDFCIYRKIVSTTSVWVCFDGNRQCCMCLYSF